MTEGVGMPEDLTDRQREILEHLDSRLRGLEGMMLKPGPVSVPAVPRRGFVRLEGVLGELWVRPDLVATVDGAGDGGARVRWNGGASVVRHTVAEVLALLGEVE